MRVTGFVHVVGVAGISVAAGCGSHEPQVTTVSPGNTATAASGCSGQHFAVHGACRGGGDCIRLFEVTPACTVRDVREIDLSETTERIVDLAWPTGHGPLYVVAELPGRDAWAWAAIDAPLTATDAQIAATAWTSEKLGDIEPDGFQFGVEVAGVDAVLVGCARWEVPEAEEAEEWDCMGGVFRAAKGTQRLDHLPPPPFSTAWREGPVAGDVSLRAHGSALECRAGDGAWIETGEDVPLATAAVDGDRYFLFQLRGGNRGRPGFEVAATLMTGCARTEAIEGDVVPGPAALWARRGADPTVWQIERSGTVTPLRDAAGAEFGVAGDQLVWTAP